MKTRTVQVLEDELIQAWIYHGLIPDKATGIAIIQEKIDEGQIKRLADGKTLEFDVPECPGCCGGCDSDKDCSENCDGDCDGGDCQCDSKKN